jgi:hypothetical protein
MRTERAILRRHSLHSSQQSIEDNFVKEKFRSAVRRVSDILSFKVDQKPFILSQFSAPLKVMVLNNSIKGSVSYPPLIKSSFANDDMYHDDDKQSSVLNSVFSERCSSKRSVNI